MKNTKASKKGNTRKMNNLTTEDRLKGFEVLENNFENEYQRRKKHLGLSPGERITVRWK
jgi:hypothetical protein